MLYEILWFSVCVCVPTTLLCVVVMTTFGRLGTQRELGTSDFVAMVKASVGPSNRHVAVFVLLLLLLLRITSSCLTLL